MPIDVVHAEDSNILVVGDSLSAAYGMAAEQSWVSLLQNRLRVQGYRNHGAAILIQCRNFGIIEPDLTGAGFVQTGKHRQQRRFARAGNTDYGNRLAGINLQVDVIQYG